MIAANPRSSTLSDIFVTKDDAALSVGGEPDETGIAKRRSVVPDDILRIGGSPHPREADAFAPAYVAARLLRQMERG